MTYDVPTPPPAEAARQKMVHNLRNERRNLVRGLAPYYMDNRLLADLIRVNAQIQLLKDMREPYLDSTPEPSLDEVRDRGLKWYWEPWDMEESEDDDED